MINENVITTLKNEIFKASQIVVIPHKNPDGDAMGSTLGLYHFLKLFNLNVTVISPNQFPEFLQWLPNSEEVIIYEKNEQKADILLEKADLIFTLDFNAFHRTGDVMGEKLSKLNTTFVMIDHHELPESYAKFTFSNTLIGSTCQMVYHFIEDLGYVSKLNSTIATCLYTGIVTDSGSFRYSNTTSLTHKIAANLIELGIENSTIHSNLFDTSSYNRLQLLGKALQNMKLLPEFGTAYITLSKEELKEFNFEKGDTEGFVNYGLSIKGIYFAAIFIENNEENYIKISFRSQGDFDVNQFSRRYFDGGGHKNASGGKSLLNLNETIQYLKI